MEKLNKDELYTLGLNLNTESLLNFCISNKRFNEKICKDENFWKSKLERDYPMLIKFNEFKNWENENWKNFYLEMIYYISKIKSKYDLDYISYENFNPKEFYMIGYEKDGAIEKYAIYAAILGKLDLVKSLIEKGAKNFKDILYFASEEGNIDVVELMIEKGAKNFNSGLIAASYKGEMNIIKLMIKKGAGNFNDGLKYAAWGGHIDIVKFFIEKGANNFKEAIRFALDAGHKNIIKYLNDFL